MNLKFYANVQNLKKKYSKIFINLLDLRLTLLLYTAGFLTAQ